MTQYPPEDDIQRKETEVWSVQNCMCSKPPDGEMIPLILYEYYFRKFNNHSVVDTNSSPFFLHLSELSCRLRIYILSWGLRQWPGNLKGGPGCGREDLLRVVSEIELARLFNCSLQSHWEKEESGPIPHCWFGKKEKDLPVPRESADAETLAIL